MITAKTILDNIPKNSSFRKWFIDNIKVLTNDINAFFSKFKGNEISIETVKPLTSWSIHIPKEHKTNLYNTLARLKGQQVIASYGISDKKLNKIISEALKENNDIEASDDVKSYLKVNYNEFYKELFSLLRTYETLGNKSAEPIAKILANNLGAEKGRPIKFCQEFRTYLVKLLKNVIDSVNNTMNKIEKPITASSECSVESILKSILEDAKNEANKVLKETNEPLSKVTTEFSKSDSMICCELVMFNSKIENKVVFWWTKENIQVNTFEIEGSYVRPTSKTVLGISDFDKLKKEIKKFINSTHKKIIELKPITASSECSVEEVLRSVLEDAMNTVRKYSAFATNTFSVTNSKIMGSIKIPSGNDTGYIEIMFEWSVNGIDASIQDCGSHECATLHSSHFGVTDFEGLRKELNSYFACAKDKLSSVNNSEIDEKVEIEEVDSSDIKDVCKIILNSDKYDNDLKAQANLYISLCTAGDVNTAYMQTLSDSIISSYKNKNNIATSLSNEILIKLKNFLEQKFTKLNNFSSKIVDGIETLVCFYQGEICFYFKVGSIDGKNVILCSAEHFGGYRDGQQIEVVDETTTLTEVECWLKQFFAPTSKEEVTASKKKTKWTRAEIVKFAKENNATEFTSPEEYRKVNNTSYLECLGYARDINGNIIARLWQDRKTKKYYFCTHSYTLMVI